MLLLLVRSQLIFLSFSLPPLDINRNLIDLSISLDSVKHATGPLLIEIEKSPGSTIGISLTQKWLRNNRSIIVIDNVKPASIADR